MSVCGTNLNHTNIGHMHIICIAHKNCGSNLLFIKRPRGVFFFFFQPFGLQRIQGRSHALGEHTGGQRETKWKNREWKMLALKCPAHHWQEKLPMMWCNQYMKVCAPQVDQGEPVAWGDCLKHIPDAQHVERNGLEKRIQTSQVKIGCSSPVFLGLKNT